MPDLTTTQWYLAVFAALGIGIAKSGFSGVGLFPVVVFAGIFGAKVSTGALLPMLIVGDISSLLAFRQHARWDYVRRILPPAVIGILAGWLLMQELDETAFRPVVGIVVLGLTMLQIARMWRPRWFADIPHATWFAWSLGLFAGFTTMVANAAGPIVAIYLLAVSLPKYEYVGASAWFFLIVNVFKVPFSASLGLIERDTLLFNAALAPLIVVGLLAGRWLVHRIPQRLFDSLLLLFAGVAALRLIGAF